MEKVKAYRIEAGITKDEFCRLLFSIIEEPDFRWQAWSPLTADRLERLAKMIREGYKTEGAKDAKSE